MIATARRTQALSRAGLAVLACAFLLAAAVPVAAAPVLVDSFTTNQTTLTAPPPASSSVLTAGSDIVGLRRGLAVDRSAGTGNVSAGVGAGTLTFTVTDGTPNTRGTATVSWDGDAAPLVLSPSGLGGVDLTSAGTNSGLSIEVTAVTGAVEMIVTIYTDGANASRGGALVTATGAVVLPFSQLAVFAGTGADLTDVGAIVLEILGTESSASIDQIRAIPPAVAAIKVDLDTSNVPLGATTVVPGDTIRYRVTITNPGGEATAVDISDTIDTNVELPGAEDVLATPVAQPRQYIGFGNVTLTVSNPLDGLLKGARDPDQGGSNPIVQLAGSETTSTQGGTINYGGMTDGTFTYVPPAGFRGVDTFDFTVIDNDTPPQTTLQTATIALGERVWFVDDSAAPAGNGTQALPFDAIADVNGAGDPDEANEIIFFFAGTYDAAAAGGFLLEPGQRILGQGLALVLGGQTIVSAGAAPTFTNSLGNGLVLAPDNTLRGFTVGNTTGIDVFGTSFGTLTVSDVTLNGTGGALDLTTGILAATFNSVTSTSSVRGIRLDAATGTLDTGSTTISGATNTGIVVLNGGSTYDFGPTTISSSAAGIDLSTSATSTFNFDSLSITTTAGAGLKAATAGTIAIGGASNTISATGGAALDLTSTSLGTGATFSSLSSTTSAGRGIDLDTVAGNLTVTTTTITNPTGVGIERTGSPGTASFGGTSVDKSSTTGIGVSLSSNGGATTFTTLAVTTSNGRGLVSSTNSGAINVTTATGSSVAATGGAAIDITNASGNPPVNLNFATLTTTNSTNNGINLDRVGGTGLTVTGATTLDMAVGSSNVIDLTNITSTTVSISTASTVGVNDRRATGIFIDTASSTIGFGAATIPNPNGAGGYGIRVEDSSANVTFASAAISNTTQTTATSDAGSDGIPDSDGDGDAIFLKSNTGNFTLNGGSLTNLATDGIDFRNSKNLTVSNVTIDEIGSGSANGNTVDDSGIFIIDTNGTVLVQDSVISHFDSTVTGGVERGIKLRNQGVNFTELRVNNTDFTNNAALGIRGDDGILVEGYGAVSGKVVVENGSTFSGLSGEGVQVNAGQSVGSGTIEVDILDSTFQNPVNPGGFGGVSIASAGNNGAGSVGTANLDVEIRGSTFTNLHPGNANAGTIFLTPFSRGTFKAVVDDNDMTGPGAPGRGAIRASPGDLADEELQTFSLVINNNRIDNFGDDGIFLDIRGESLTTSGNAGQIEITNNMIGITTRVGQDGIEGITIRCRTSPIGVGAKTVNLLVHNNQVRNNDNSVGDETLDLDAEDACTINATVTSNTFTSNGSAQDEFRAATEAAASVMCLDLRNNTATQGAGPAGNGSLTVEELAGSLSLRHSGNSPAATIVGGVAIIGSGCTLPTP